jgi:hypothetical protein
MADALETELKTYEAQKDTLLAHEGKFVVIHGSEILGIYGSYEDALKAGYEKFKLEPFLVKKIQAVDLPCIRCMAGRQKRTSRVGRRV